MISSAPSVFTLVVGARVVLAIFIKVLCQRVSIPVLKS